MLYHNKDYHLFCVYLESKDVNKFRFIENLVANANIKKCEKDLEDTTIIYIYEVDTAVKMWQNEGMNATKSWERAEQMRKEIEGK